MGRDDKIIPSFYSSSWVFHVFLCCLLIHFSPTDGYDPLDPNGNITIKWDIMDLEDTYSAVVTIYNFQLYRHIEKPGWRLGWAWKGDEVIWKMWGAEATEQGNCSKFSSGELPHCCEKKPMIIDFLPGAASYKDQFSNCCRGGVLSSMTQDPTNYASSFQLAVGNALTNGAVSPPENFTLGVPGYTCGPLLEVPPTRFTDDGGRRWRQAVTTWNGTCSYSQFRALKSPTCCVSLSSFYNTTIVPCTLCSCGCQEPKSKCVKFGQPPPLIKMPNGNEALPPMVRCTSHMCPIRVHWHVKVNYKQYWRVKVTVTNFNYVKNYSQWNLVVQHPNLKSVEQSFSFSYKPLNQYGHINDTGMFWGIPFYNDMLLQASNDGSVQTEILLKKDPSVAFSFEKGWAFPRRISFNGDECVMPPPDAYPMLPNGSTRASPKLAFSLLFFLLFIFF